MPLSKMHFFELLCIYIMTAFFSSCSQKSSLPAGDIDNGGLFLPDKFEAVVVADSIGNARHLAVNKNGDIYVKLTYAKLYINVPIFIHGQMSGITNTVRNNHSFKFIGQEKAAIVNITCREA